MNDFLRIGLIQPVIDPDTYWNHDSIPSSHYLNIHPIFAERVWQEIQQGLKLFLADENRPDMILIPELHLPIARINELKRISKHHSIIIIAGVDFQTNPSDPRKIRNRGVLIFPNSFERNKPSTRVTTLHFGKTYFTYMEKNMFRDIDGQSYTEDREQNMYIFQTQQFGDFGIMICSDIFDIERMILYQTRIHHLFVISLNKDINTHFAMAESLTRLIYCNVVICNTGHFGGSLAFSPYRDANERMIYKYYGQRSFTIHQAKLPVKELDDAQKRDYSVPNPDRKFKASPPGYFDKTT